MITGYWCDLHRGTATEVQAHVGPRGVIQICTDCWAEMGDEARWPYLRPVGPVLRVPPYRGSRR